MRAGRLNQRITLQQRLLTTDGYGSPVTTWIDLATVWATLTQITGKESWASERVLNESVVAFRIRYLAGITPEMRLTHNGIQYEIQSVIDPTMRSKELIITARVEQ